MIVNKKPPNWCDILVAVQMNEIPPDDLPRLLFDCINELLDTKRKMDGILDLVSEFQNKVQKHRFG